MTPEEIDRVKRSRDLYGMGVLPSKLDPRDRAFKAVRRMGAAPFPDVYKHPGVGHLPVRNQQGGTCVGNSIALTMQMNEYVENASVVPIVGELINGRVVGRQFGEGAGMTPRDGLDDVLNHGAAAFIRGSAVLYFPAAYAVVDHTNPAAVKEAMSTPGTALTAATWLLSNFGAGGRDANGLNFGGKDYIHDIPGESPWTYHEITFVGYDAQGVLFQNSWGTSWGDGGFGRLAWDFVAARVGELWAVTDNADNAGGRVNEWTAPTEPNAGRAVRKGSSAAVYLLETGGRVWVQSLAMAKQMGIDMSKVQSLSPTAMEWNTPVIGPDAPQQYQG